MTHLTWKTLLGLVGSLGGLAIDATVNNDATRTFDAEIGTAVAGASVGIEMSGNLADTSDVAHGVEVGMSAMGLDLGIAWTKLARSAYLLAWALTVEAKQPVATCSARSRYLRC